MFLLLMFVFFRNLQQKSEFHNIKRLKKFKSLDILD